MPLWDRFGEPGVLTIHMLPVPVPDAHEILIAVHTAGVGTWDADLRAGWWPEGKPKFPLVLGTDGSGVVVQRGYPPVDDPSIVPDDQSVSISASMWW